MQQLSLIDSLFLYADLADCIQSSLNELEHALDNKELEHDFFKELADKYEVSEEQKSML